MSELRFTETNAGDDSAGKAFGLEGNLYLPVVAGIVLGVLLFGGCTFVGAGVTIAIVGGSVPVLVAFVWVGLHHGKPAGFAADRFDAISGGGSFSRKDLPVDRARSHADAPEGRFVEGMLLFGAPENGGIAAKGFRLERPDLRGASHERLNALQEQVQAMLALVAPGCRLQVQWWVDADYREALLKYHACTQEMPDASARQARNERFTRYWRRMLDGTLRREHLVIFLSVEVSAEAPFLGSREGVATHYSAVIEELASQFEEFATAVRAVFGTDTSVHPLGDEEHFLVLRRFLNPTQSARSDENPMASFDQALTIQENCWHCEGVAQPGGGFALDGHFHAVLTLSRWPQRTRPGIVTHLTGLPFLDYALTVNITPVAGRREIEKEEKAAERLRGEYADKPRASLLVALRKKERKVEALAGGFARPFHVTYVIRVWAPTPEALREKVAAVQGAVNAMDGAQCFECAIPTSAKKLFFATWPGWTHSSYRYRELYAEDTYLADLLPFSATFTGALAEAEALYDGSQGNLVGVSTAAGGSPQHAVVFGMTGAGKSAFIEDLLLQTAGLFAHTLIVEEGESYRRVAATLGEQSIVIHPDSGVTLNYLDTQGLPLTQLHLATAVALLARIVGTPDDAERLALRQAQITEYLHLLYRQAFTEWARLKPKQAEEVRRFACALHRWKTKLAAGVTLLDAFVDLRDRVASREEEAQAFVGGMSEAEVARFAEDAANERFIAQVACAFYTPEEFPTHSGLVDLLTHSRQRQHEKAEIDRLATLLRAWTAEGQYGRLFDGTTNISLRRRFVLIELGLIPEHAIEMKAAAGLLISGLGRQHILSLPRSQRKRLLFEELARFLDIPGGEQIVAEGYAQLRKHNCWCASVIQQYARFKHSRVRGAVIGNAKQFFFMRQADRADLADVARDLPLPESAVEAIQRYPLPEQLPDEKRHSSLCYFLPTAQPPQCGTVRHFQEEPCTRAA